MSEGINKEKFDSYKEYALNKSVLWNHIVPLVSEFSNFPDSIISRDIQNRDYIIKNCIRLKNYLLYFKTNSLCDDNKCCGYFNFWLNKNARKEKQIKEINFSHYKNCVKYYSSPIESNKCISEIYYMEHSEFEKKKRLYDLYDYYNEFNQIMGDYSKCSFHNICADKYNDIIGKCKNGLNDGFCQELIKFGNNFLKYILTSTEQCKENFVELLSPENAMLKEEEEEEEEEEEAEERKQQQPPLLPLEVEGEAEKAGQEQVKLENVAGLEADLGAMESVLMPNEIRASEKIPGHSASEDFVEHQNSNTHKPIGTIIGTSFGFFIPLTMLYRFTPLGNWINTKILGRDKLMDNMKQNAREFQLNSEHNRDINSGDTIYHIKYNSVLNE